MVPIVFQPLLSIPGYRSDYVHFSDGFAILLGPVRANVHVLADLKPADFYSLRPCADFSC